MVSGWLAARALADDAKPKGQAFESEAQVYADGATEFPVYRLTDASYTSTLPAAQNRIVSRNSGSLLYGCDRDGSPQAFRMNLKSGDTEQLTDRPALDPRSLTFLPDNRSFCYLAERTLYQVMLANLRERPVYTVPDGWEPSRGICVAADGAHVGLIERRSETSRLRLAPLPAGPARTVVEVPFGIADPMERPQRAQWLYRKESGGLGLVDAAGRQNRNCKLAAGGAGSVWWSADGKSLLYLNFPEDRTQLNAIREYLPDDETDKLVAKTSQYASFGVNRDASVFVGASQNKASPVILLMLRVTHRELTLCEHRASQPQMVTPIFSPDAQRIYFQSDLHGKPALYSVHVERLVEKIENDVP